MNPDRPPNPFEDAAPRRAAGILATGFLVMALVRWRSGLGASWAAFLAGATIAVAVLALDRSVKASGITLAPDSAVINADEPRATALLRRYEVVIVALAGIVVFTHVAGGTFRAQRLTGNDTTIAGAPLTAPASEPIADAITPPPPTVTDQFLPSTLAVPSFGSDFLPSYPDFSSATPSAQAPFADGGNLGDQAPFATVGSPGQPTGIAVGPSGDAWVTAAAGPIVFHFGADGALLAKFKVPDAQSGFAAAILSRSGDLFLASTTPASVLRFSPVSGTSAVYATIPDATVPCAPPAVTTDCDASAGNGPPMPTAIAFDAGGRLYVADAGQGIVWRVAPGGGTPTTFIAQSSWMNPTRPSGPTGLAIDGAGNLVIAVRGTLTDDTGAIFVQKIGADGTAGTLSQLATTGAGSRPGGLVLAKNGNAYVTLTALGRVLVLGSDGKERGQTPAGAALDTPVGIAFRGQSVLVAAQTPGDLNHGRVVRLPVGASGAVIYAL